MRKRRPAKLLILCLILGAVINVLVAWAWSLGPPFKVPGELLELNQSARSFWARHVRLDVAAPDGQLVSHTGGASLVTISRFDEPSSTSTYASIPPDVHWLTIFSSGWPVRSFYASMQSGESDWHPIISIRPGPFASDGYSRVLPCRPLWSGLIVNTIFYAAIVWLMIRGPWETRRRWRELHGRCGPCGYPRGESPVCTECGSDLSRSWRPLRHAVSK